MAGSSNQQFQSLGNGAYRVTGARVSPTTGRYVTRSSESGRIVTRETESGSASSASKSTGRK